MEKKFIYPEAIIVKFADEDIIVTSGDVGEGGMGETPDDEWWGKQ